jgi:hypothetical protein
VKDTPKDLFIKSLALMLADDVGSKSMMLELTRKDPTNKAHVVMAQWADLRTKAQVVGYPTVEEAEQQLREFLK